MSKRRMERTLNALLPHRELVTVTPYLGGGANGRVYGTPVTLKRAQILDDIKLIRDQYDKETSITAVVYCERSELEDIPIPETRVTIWAGTRDQRDAHVESAGRYEHPEFVDLLEVRLT
ncbi:hypothetical protein G7068_13790 [Leucobacter viscericola]|uniref:Uncharacterized protein n=1 Tax=Leucobacter viscericola TaxID=2714935 RepID=A0A6G7XIF5_9MICO|nr:hypothetical protein [Leucobacter viscericola]QIK64151.1 hypothetical protein G7068_13790 [Leucobacter viscericola]